MTAQIIDGKAMRDAILAETEAEAQAFTERTGIVPGLVVILVGEDPASQSYVRSKEKTCKKMGCSARSIPSLPPPPFRKSPRK
jgi:methylenetetrahydrofolate dehydrogenase (NADP+)/methenyltetrahydrofolate cyclohydrolase